MNVTSPPDFADTLAIAQGSLDAAELTECHGVACGLLCRLPDSSTDAFMALLGQLELVVGSTENLRSCLEELLNSSRQQLTDEDFGLNIWMPDDEETLEQRTLALSQWCSGFLAGLGSGGKDSLQGMSDDANGALLDLQQIAKAEVDDAAESEVNENAFADIVEYIRVVILLIREDLQAFDSQDAGT